MATKLRPMEHPATSPIFQTRPIPEKLYTHFIRYAQQHRMTYSRASSLLRAFAAECQDSEDPCLSPAGR